MTENESIRPEGEPAPPTVELPAAEASEATSAQPVPPALGEGQPPIWAQPPAQAAMPAPQAPTPNRARRWIAGSAAAVVLLGATSAGSAWLALQLDDKPAATSSSNNGSNAAAPVIERSSLAQIAARVEPSVVSIDTGTGEGSGVVLTKDGYILTNNHVVATARGNTMTVTFNDGKTAKATVVGTDARSDLAVIKAQGVSNLTPATFGDSSSMQVGDTVLALGSPLGLQGSVTAGIISAKDRTIQVSGENNSSPLEQQQTPVTSISGVLQTDAAINPGNSGGALVNLNGEVIGINTAIATSGNSNGNIGVGFAIPGNRAKQVADQLMKGEKVSHPLLGVSVTQGTDGGAIVDSVTSGSPADKAGLQKGDVITKVDDTVIHDSDDVVSAIQAHKVGDRVKVTYTRGGAEKTTTVTLAEAS